MLQAGSEIGSYVVESFIDTGGMASVLKVRHRVLGSVHALKVLRPDLVANDSVRARFLEEGRVQAQLRHPGLVRVTDIVSEPGVAGLVMDLLEGETLSQRIDRGAIPTGQAVAWMLQVLAAVGYAHERGIVHRDLKPSNVFLVVEGTRKVARILDFGIAKVSDRRRTHSQATLGTYAYMSPEQLQDPASVDHRTDVFSLGAVLYEMVTAETPFEGQTDYHTMQAILAGEYDPIERHVGDVPDALSSAVRKALATEADDRFASCDAFAEALQDLAEEGDLELVDSWQGSGSYEVKRAAPTLVADDPEIRGLFEEDPPELPVPVPKAVADDTPRIRAAATLQVLSAGLNLVVLWFVACMGLGNVSVFLAGLLGVPGWISWIGYATGLMGFGLILVGLVELCALFALIRPKEGRHVVRTIAWIELASLAFGGLFAALVGTIALVLVRRSPPSEA